MSFVLIFLPIKVTYIYVSLLYQKGQFEILKRSILHKLKINIQHERNEAENLESIRGRGNRVILPAPSQVNKIYPEKDKSSHEMQRY